MLALPRSLDRATAATVQIFRCQSFTFQRPSRRAQTNHLLEASDWAKNLPAENLLDRQELPLPGRCMRREAFWGKEDWKQEFPGTFTMSSAEKHDERPPVDQVPLELLLSSSRAPAVVLDELAGHRPG